jgi:hypothetical protein
MPLQTTCYVKVTFPEEIKVNIDETVTGALVSLSPSFMDGATKTVASAYSATSTSSNFVVFSACSQFSSGYSQKTAFQVQ